MIIRTDVENVLRQEDIESLLKAGAPLDEYSSEATDIEMELNKLPAHEFNEASIAAVIALVWQRYFKLSGPDIEKRMFAFRSVARRILAQWG